MILGLMVCFIHTEIYNSRPLLTKFSSVAG